MSRREIDPHDPTGIDPVVGPPPASLQIPHPRPFVCRLRVDRAHLSPTIEHVSNIEYVRWLDRLAELHADALGHTRQRLLEQGIMWFVARHEIDYLAEAWLDDELGLATWVRHMGRVKAWRDSVVWRTRDQSVICRASTLWVLVDLEQRRPIRIPKSTIEGFAPLEVGKLSMSIADPPCTLR